MTGSELRQGKRLTDSVMVEMRLLKCVCDTGKLRGLSGGLSQHTIIICKM